MPRPTYNENIVAGPFSVHFCNQNTEMQLKGHCHFAQVYFDFETTGSVGFPSFEHTHAEIQARLRVLMEKPWKSCTNEEVLRRTFDAFLRFPLDSTKRYNAEYQLVGMELHVRGVPDAIGHADAFTVYKIHI